MSSPMDIDLQLNNFRQQSPTLNLRCHFDAANFDEIVNDSIQKRMRNATGDFMYGKLMYEDGPILLGILLEAFLEECHMDLKACKTYLFQHESLAEKLNQAYVNKRFADLMEDPEIPLEQARLKVSGIPASGRSLDLAFAFETPYRGDMDKIFIRTVNRMRDSYVGVPATKRPYNWSIAVIQSSGMGKSRMVDEASKSVFTIPINIRENLPDGKKVVTVAYPLPDKKMRQFFEESWVQNEKQQQAYYMVLLQVLFTTAQETVQKFIPEIKGEKQARAWANFLKKGQTEANVGSNREDFYNEVYAKATKAVKDQKTLDDLERSLQRSCAQLVEFLQPTPTTENACFIYFDEAHSLTESVKTPSEERNHSPYHNLGTVLSKLTDYQVFFIFLSTNSCIENLSLSPSHYPWDRAAPGWAVIPPFTELPFDLYEHEVLKSIGLLTLDNVCTTKAMVGFGRTLWHAQHEIKPRNNILQFAMDKLTASGLREEDAVLAALGVRVGLTLDKTNPATYSIESRLVESHLRVVYSIPRHRGFMHTGSPSEPVVAEAACRFLNGPELKISRVGPNRLFSELEKGHLVRGERGELVGRLLVTVAHDTVLQDSVNLNQREPQFHRPIPVLDYLRALFHWDHHGCILDAKPITGQSDAASLREAFSESFVYFSHFALSEDSEMLSTPALTTALVRGMAIQAKDGQESIDAVIPVHMGRLDTPISPETTSAINLQFRNRKNANDCHVNRSITVPDPEMPVISIVFEFGVKKPESQSVIIDSDPDGTAVSQENPLHPDDRHYRIIVYGCSSAVFGVIDSKTEPQYQGILGTRTILTDFPRRNYQDNSEAMMAMRPAFSGERQIAAYSKFFNLGTEQDDG